MPANGSSFLGARRRPPGLMSNRKRFATAPTWTCTCTCVAAGKVPAARGHIVAESPPAWLDQLVNVDAVSARGGSADSRPRLLGGGHRPIAGIQASDTNARSFWGCEQRRICEASLN